MAEFYWNILRKPKVPPSLAEVDAWVDKLSEQPFAAVDVNLVRVGIFLSQRFQIAYWDGALLAAAERLGAPVFYTEDLNHGQFYGSVRAINPFLPD